MIAAGSEIEMRQKTLLRGIFVTIVASTAIRTALTATDLKTMVYAYPTSCSDVSYMIP